MQSGYTVAKINDHFSCVTFNDGVSFGTFAVNDLTLAQKTLYGTAIAFVHIAKVFPDLIMVLAAIKKCDGECVSHPKTYLPIWKQVCTD